MWEDNFKVNLGELGFPCVNSVDQIKTKASKLSLILAVLNVFWRVRFYFQRASYNKIRTA